MSKSKILSELPDKVDDIDEAIDKSHDQNTDSALDEGGSHEVTAEAIRDHVDSTDNPHGTTAGQTGAYTKQETDQAISHLQEALDGKAELGQEVQFSRVEINGKQRLHNLNGVDFGEWQQGQRVRINIDRVSGVHSRIFTLTGAGGANGAPNVFRTILSLRVLSSSITAPQFEHLVLREFTSAAFSVAASGSGTFDILIENNITNFNNDWSISIDALAASTASRVNSVTIENIP